MLSLLNEIESEAPTSPNSREAGSIGVKSAISLSIVEDSFKPIHDGIDIIQNANLRIKELINIKRTGLPTQQKNAMTEADDLVSQTTNIIRTVNISFKRIKANMDTTEDKTQAIWISNKYNTYLTSFQKHLQSFQEISTQFKDTCHNDFIRQAKIIDPNITEHQIQQMLQVNDPNQYLQENIMAISPDLLDDINVLENEHKRMQKIEKSMEAISEMMNACQILINDNQIVINTIQDNVEKTKLDAQQGQIELMKAEVYTKKTRRNKVISFLCCFIILAIIILFIVLWAKKILG